MSQPEITQTSDDQPTLPTAGAHGRAIDQALELLGAVLRTEAADGHQRRAQLLRGRLAGASQSALRARVVDVPTHEPTTSGR